MAEKVLQTGKTLIWSERKMTMNTNAFEKHESEVRSYCRNFPAVFTKAKDSFIYAEDGKEYTSRQLAAKLGAIDRKIVLVIGGPYGLTPEVKARAEEVWALSKLTFTHEMARLLLSEQLFRAATILNGGSYHND